MSPTGTVMQEYLFEGTVLLYGKAAAWNYKAKTSAASISKAQANIKYRFKQTNNIARNVPVTLDGVLCLITEEPLRTAGKQ